MTRTLTLIAVGGIATALVCLPLAAALYHHSGASRSWSWSDQLGWLDDDDDDNDNNSTDEASNSNQIASRDFAWTGGGRLELDVPGNLHFQPAAEWHLSIRGPVRALDRLSVNDGRIAMKHSYHHHFGQLDIELSGPALREVTLNGAGKLVLDHLKQDSLTVAIHGSGSVRATGSIDSLKVDIMGSGDALLEHLAARSTKIFIAGSGDADIAPIDDADVFIAGSGDVRLHTHPKHLNSKVAGSGQIIELSDEQKT
jgi:Putative auto-transporter adhesin, head GIN domain